MTLLRPLWRSAVSQMLLSFARPMMQFLVLFNPLLAIASYYFLFKQGNVSGGGEYVLVGSSLILLWGTILWSSATDIDRERWMGTFELLLIAPVPFPVTIFGKIVGNMVLGVITLVINVLCGWLLFGLTVDVAAPAQLAVTLLVCLASFSGFSLMLALLFTLARGANNIANGLAYPIYLFSGLLFPLTLLPGWARAIGLVMPLGWAREAVLSLARISRVVFMMQFGWMRPSLYALTILFRPVTQVLFFGIVARFVIGQTDVAYWVIGNASLACLFSSFYSVADLLQLERSNGTLSLLALAPRSLLYVFAGRGWLVAMHGLVSTVVSLAVGVIAFGMDISQIAWGPFGLALVTAVFATASLGAAVGSLGMYTDAVNIVNNVVASLLLIFSGINFPISVLPTGLQPVAKLLPMTHGTAAARLAAGLEMTGLGPAASLSYGALIGHELLAGIGWLLVGWVLFGWAARRARHDGTLDLF